MAEQLPLYGVAKDADSGAPMADKPNENKALTVSPSDPFPHCPRTGRCVDGHVPWWRGGDHG